MIGADSDSRWKRGSRRFEAIVGSVCISQSPLFAVTDAVGAVIVCCGGDDDGNGSGVSSVSAALATSSCL